MKSSSFVSAFGGVVLIGAVAAPGSAMAFGQQWRPATGYAPVSAARYQRVANMPNFRPPVGASAGNLRRVASYPDYRQPYQRQRVGHQPASHPRQVAVPMQYRVYGNGFGHRYGVPPLPRQIPAQAPNWGNPFQAMANAWQPPMPMFGGQPAWHPAAQGWPMRAPVQAYRMPQRFDGPRYGARDTAPAPRGLTGMQQARRTVAPPGYRGWRPVAQAASGLARPVFRGSTTRLPAWQGRPQPAPLSGAFAASDAGARHNWRPAFAAAAPSNSGFRPAAYGRSTPLDTRVAAENASRPLARDGLPGWATTYPDGAGLGGCTWCSGS